MAQHNLSTVIGFEFVRTIKKKSFWLATLAVPVFGAVLFGLVFISSNATDKKAEEQRNEKFSI